MKLFLTIVSIAMMAQASMAASLGRVKRVDDVEKAFEDLLKMSRDLLDLSVILATEFYKELPKSAEFAKINQDLKEFLDVAHDLETKSDNCVIKTGKALEALFKLLAKYDSGEAESSANDKTIEELLEKIDGGKLKQSAKDFAEKYYNKSFLEKIESYKEEKVENWAFLKENC